MTRKWLLCSLLLLAAIPVLLSTLPAFGAGYGGGGNKTMITSTIQTSTTQVTMASATSVPEHIDLTLPLLTVVGFLWLFMKRKEAGLE